MQNNAPPSSASAKAGYETGDPRLRNPLIVVASAILLMFLGLATTALLMWSFSQSRPLNRVEPLGIIAAPNAKPLERFPAPYLDTDDSHGQSTALRQEQWEKLNSYGWVDRSNGVVRIPIERAMGLILKAGLPTRTNAPSPIPARALKIGGWP